MKFKNKYFLLRHGESSVNLNGLVSCWPEKIYSPLTGKGVRQIEEAAKKLKNERIDFIFSSDILRTKQTAEIVGRKLGIKPRFDKRLRDVNLGIFNGKLINEAGKFWVPGGKKLSPLAYYKRRFTITPPKGENYLAIEKRLLGFLKDMEKKYQGKNILIVSHKRPFTLLEKMVFGWSIKKFIENIVQNKEMKNGELRKLWLS
mgnify:CR=1 FL=1